MTFCAGSVHARPTPSSLVIPGPSDDAWDVPETGSMDTRVGERTDDAARGDPGGGGVGVARVGRRGGQEATPAGRLPSHHRQYAGVITESGEHLIALNAFCDDAGVD